MTAYGEFVDGEARFAGAVSAADAAQDASVFVDYRRDAAVGAANHRATVFGAAQNGLGKMLLGLAGTVEPGVVCKCRQNVRTLLRGVSREVREGVFKADQSSGAVA